MCFFDEGDKVAIRFWNREEQKFDYKSGIIKSKYDINHYVVKLDEDNELYSCHTSKIVSVSMAEKVEEVKTLKE